MTPLYNLSIVQQIIVSYNLGASQDCIKKWKINSNLFSVNSCRLINKDNDFNTKALCKQIFKQKKTVIFKTLQQITKCTVSCIIIVCQSLIPFKKQIIKR